MPAGSFDLGRINQPVSEGDVIGSMGCTGSCTGTHVHFAIDTSSGITNNWRFKNSLNQAPNAPILLQPANGASGDNTTVVFNWQDGGDADNGPRAYRDYRVELWQQGSTWHVYSPWIVATQWSAMVPGPGNYLWRVISGDGIDASPESPTWAFTVQSQPTAPTNFSVAGRTSSTLTLQWSDNATSESGYRIYRWDGARIDWVLLTTLSANSSQYTDAGLVCNAPYNYRVAAYNTSGEQFHGPGWIEGITAACEPGPTPNIAPNLPGLVAPASGAVFNTTSMTIRVQDGGDPDNGPNLTRNFMVQLERLDGSWSTSVQAPDGIATVNLPGYGNYRWRAQANDGAANSSWTDWGQFTAAIPVPVTAPPVPRVRPNGAWAVTHYRQGDPQWGGARIGSCANTITNVGCALTSLAMIFHFYGADHNPGTLNTCLAGDACLMRWSSPRIEACSSGKVAFAGWRAFSYSQLELELTRGPVILEIRKGASLHFVVALKGSGSDPHNYIVNDPGLRNGANVPLSTTLAVFKGFAPSSMRVYRGTPATTNEVLAPTSLPNLTSPALTAGETITGTLALFDATEDDMILELAAQSDAGAVTEMQISIGQQPSSVWQPYTPYVSLPIASTYTVQFRDATGNLSALITTGVPIVNDVIQEDITHLYIPMVQQ